MPRRFEFPSFCVRRCSLSVGVSVLVVACAREAPHNAAGERAIAVGWSAAHLDTLLRLGREDQAAREGGMPLLSSADTAAAFAMMREDSSRTRWVRAAVSRDGWPVRTAAGDSALDAAWYILQHSPDTAWQGSALIELETLSRRGEVPRQNLALLTDRVLNHRGLPQRYGSQFEERDGRLVPAPVEDLAGLDARRASMGMPPMQEYVQKLREVTKMPVDWPPRP